MTKQNELQEQFITKTVEFFKKHKVGYLNLAMRFGKCRTTIEVLKKLFPAIEFRKSSGPDDHTYAIDYELYKNGDLKCAIQIKPNSYWGDKPYLIAARSGNERKFNAYKQTHP